MEVLWSFAGFISIVASIWFITCSPSYPKDFHVLKSLQSKIIF